MLIKTRYPNILRANDFPFSNKFQNERNIKKYKWNACLCNLMKTQGGILREISHFFYKIKATKQSMRSLCAHNFTTNFGKFEPKYVGGEKH